ncbi:MAG: hypothetical protein AAF750_05135 [Planctomycetota bacterium]
MTRRVQSAATQELRADAGGVVDRGAVEEGEAGEVVAVVAFNIFTNYFNHVLQTDIDCTTVELPEPAATA